jgi:hypothetical protein
MMSEIGLFSNLYIVMDCIDGKNVDHSELLFQREWIELSWIFLIKLCYSLTIQWHSFSSSKMPVNSDWIGNTEKIFWYLCQLHGDCKLHHVLLIFGNDHCDETTTENFLLVPDNQISVHDIFQWYYHWDFATHKVH